ncbi:dethiobiotin synthase [Nitrosomonas marina]|uniref:ATP-dependent dethiobiotin synthetase BioD n=1 Tax=Nitrosomonas marina TaxID=917 RepID=A0A1H8EF92_9PROT|nr:dethiobiotin synthase [Nitrosomonas marina]SEN17507.1 dethiobiotin synthetase [Nitrosomonas marina]
MPPGFFITGTDTGVGKTLISCMVLHALSMNHNKVVGMKPIAAGKESGKWVDVELLRTAGSVQVADELLNPYALEQAIAPHIAAQYQGIEISMSTIGSAFQELKEVADYVIVEGAGGFMVPVNTTQDTSDMARLFDLPVILVVGMRLGCINHALLTVQAIRSAGLRLFGWVANCIEPEMRAVEENIAALRFRIKQPLLGTVPYDSAPDFRALSRLIDLSPGR